MSVANANPPYYLVAINSMGNVSYRSTPNSDERTGQPYMLEFTASRKVRAEVFRLTEELDFYRGHFKIREPLHPGRVEKTLTFAEGTTSREIAYRSAKDRRIRQLSQVFENISKTIEFGRTVANLEARDPRGLLAELKKMDRAGKRTGLTEFQAIAPDVAKLASDRSISAASRQYAHAILRENHFTG